MLKSLGSHGLWQHRTKATRGVIDLHNMTIHGQQIIDIRLEFLRLPGNALKSTTIRQRSYINPNISVASRTTIVVIHVCRRQRHVLTERVLFQELGIPFSQ
jgi:hypothetical protein